MVGRGSRSEDHEKHRREYRYEEDRRDGARFEPRAQETTRESDLHTRPPTTTPVVVEPTTREVLVMGGPVQVVARADHVSHITMESMRKLREQCFKQSNRGPMEASRTRIPRERC